VQVKEEDKLNATAYFDAYQKAQPIPNECLCMICYKEKGTSLWSKIVDFFKKIFGGKFTENDLTYSKCVFVNCNSKEYLELINKSGEDKSQGWLDLSKSKFIPCQVDKNSQYCTPRFFMIGQGANPGDFYLAQRFCEGKLTMPVFWANLKEKEQFLPSTFWLNCINSKSSLPVIVYRSLDAYPDGSKIDSIEYTKLLNSLSSKKNSEFGEYYGPVFVTTEALAYPYYFDKTSNSLKLNLTLLSKIENQLNAIRKNCPYCISVLALEPTFDNSTLLPDLCPLDYFLDVNSYTLSSLPDTQKADPLNCSKYYDSLFDYEYIKSSNKNRRKGSSLVDVVGIGFIANEFRYKLPNCDPMEVITAHQFYSKKVLQTFSTPTLWYAVGISDGPTIHENCEFTKTDVANAYQALAFGMGGLKNYGIIGIAPYVFLNNFNYLPMKCNAQKFVFNSPISLDKIVSGAAIPNENNKLTILVNRVLSKDSKSVFFESQDGGYYLAYQIPGNNQVVGINKTGCQFGFKNLDNTIHNNASMFFWFSSCQFYSTNKGPLFYTDVEPSKIKQGDKIVSLNSPNSYVFVDNITSQSSDAVYFSDNFGAYYILKKDGKKNLLYYTTPLNLQFPVAPLIFSNVGKFTTSCQINPAMTYQKVLSTSFIPLASDIYHASLHPLQEPRDLQIQKFISSMQCGKCFSSSPIPEKICQASAPGERDSFPENACLQYPQMDVAFLLNDQDPILMRAIAIGESALGSRSDKGSSAPACQIGKGKNPSACNAYSKTYEALISKSNEYCSQSDIAANIPAQDSGYYPCGLGVMQCIDFPSYPGLSFYNPFNPYDSAYCGSDKFGKYFEISLSRINSLRDKNPDINEEIPENEVEWYAALLAAYSYFQGPNHYNNGLEKYLLEYSKSSQISFAQYFVDYYSNKLQSSTPAYGLSVLKRYNNGLKKCLSGCPYRENC
jgi:hypothetical protein